MFSIACKRPLAALAVAGGLLVAAAPAGANVESPKRAISDGTSNTVFFAAVKEPQTPRADGIIAILIGAVGTSDDRSGLVSYNGHAGLGASVYQHNQTDLEYLAVKDGTSNTIGLMADMGGQF